MAKSTHFPQLLLLAFICIHFSLNGHILKPANREHSNRSAVRQNQQMYQPVRAVTVDTLATEDPSVKRYRVKKIYDTQIGVRETGNNSGEAVEKYLAYTGLGKGNPWCAAFVCWVYGQAGVANPHTAWSPDLFPQSKVIWNRGKSPVRNARLFSDQTSGTSGSTPPTPTRADIFAIYFPEKGRIAHTGFIDTWDGTWLTTVEGNTNVFGSREGDGVYRKRRLVNSIYKVARYVH